MNALLDTTLQTLGLRKLAPTTLDLKLLTDNLGRTLPMGTAQYTGAAAVSWLGTGGEDLSTNGYANHGTAFSVVKYILDVAAGLPWGVYQLDAKDNRAVLVPKHPLADLLYRPNPQQSWADFKMQAEGCYEVSGECFIRRVRPVVRSGGRGGKTAELWCLVGRVELLPTGKQLGQFDAPEGYRHYDASTGRYQDYAPDEILHLKTWNPLNPHRGLSPIQAGIDAVTAAKAGLESRVRQYQNQGPPGIIYEDSATPGDWTQGQAQGIQAYFRSFFAGGRRQGNVPVLTTKMGYVQLGLSPKDLDNLDAIPYDKDAICDLFHFPGQLLNGSRGTTFSNMGEAGAALYSRCVIPLEKVIRDGLNRWLGAEYDDGVYIDFDVSHVPELQPNKAALAGWLTTAWYVSTQEKQRTLGVEVDDTLPKYLIPAGLMTLEQLLGLAADAADAAPKLGEAVN